jgi:hypothetical protein
MEGNKSENTNKINSKKTGIFMHIERILSLKGLLNELPKKYLTKALLLFVVGVLYIANSHFYDRSVRKLNKLQQEVEALRVDYTIAKAEYMFDSKRSEVAKRLQPCGIEISDCPPFVIEHSEF